MAVIPPRSAVAIAGSAQPALGRPAVIAMIRSAIAAAMLQRRVRPSVLHRFMDQFLYRRLDVPGVRKGLG
jgi:hypothetical protein